MNRLLLILLLWSFDCRVAVSDEPGTPNREPGTAVQPLPHPVTNPGSALMLNLPATGTNPSMIDFNKLPRLPSEHAVLSDVRDQGGTRVNQHAYLAHHDGRYWAMWSDGPGVPSLNFTPSSTNRTD